MVLIGFLEWTVSGGYLNAVHDATAASFCIANVDVEPNKRRNGIAQTLIRTALEEATARDVQLVYAALISRESYEAFSRVFPQESISVTAVGDFEPNPIASTSAVLWHRL